MPTHFSPLIRYAIMKTRPAATCFARGGLSTVFVLFVVSLMACQDANPLGRQAVSGKVTFNGQPLDHGNVEFVPQEVGGVGSGAVIRQGAYQISELKGLCPGKYLVRIYSAQNDPTPASPEEVSLQSPPRLGVQHIPPQYNVKSQLIVEVTEGGSDEFNFELVGALQ